MYECLDVQQSEDEVCRRKLSLCRKLWWIIASQYLDGPRFAVSTWPTYMSLLADSKWQNTHILSSESKERPFCYLIKLNCRVRVWQKNNQKFIWKFFFSTKTNVHHFKALDTYVSLDNRQAKGARNLRLVIDKSNSINSDHARSKQSTPVLINLVRVILAHNNNDFIMWCNVLSGFVFETVYFIWNKRH